MTATVDAFHNSTWNAAYADTGKTGIPYPPHVQVGSGREITWGWLGSEPIDYYNAFKPMIDTEMAVPPQADIRASYSWTGSAFKYTVTVTNTSGATLSLDNAARVSMISYEEGDFNPASHFMVRTYAFALIKTPLANGATAAFQAISSTIPAGVNLDKVHQVVMVDYKPAGINHWENLQAAIPRLELSVSVESPLEWRVDTCTGVTQPITEILSLPHLTSWSVSESIPWLDVSPASGGPSQNPVFSPDVSQLTTNWKEGPVTITAWDSNELSYSKNLTVRARLNPPCNADLSLSAVAEPTSIDQGDIFTYTLTAANAGWYAATGVVLTNTLPAAVSFVGASPGCNNVSGKVTCSLGDLNVNASKVVNIHARADQAGVSIKNTATIKSTRLDPHLENNTANVYVDIVETDADLSLKVSPSPIWINKGDLFTLTLTATNDGPHVATGVLLTNILPAAVSFISASGCNYAGGTITCSLGDLNAGANRIINLRARADQLGTYANLASITGTWPDLTQENNTASVSVEILQLSVTPGTAQWSVGTCNPVAPPVTQVLSLPHMVSWKVTESIPWLVVTPITGGSSQNPVFSLDTSRLVSGLQQGTVTITGRDSAGGSYPKDVPVSAQLSQPCIADLSIQASALPASPQVGEPITFSFQVQNSGPMTATNVELVNTLPVGVTFISSDPAAIIDTNDQGLTLVLFKLGDMAVGANWNGKIVVTAAQAGKLHNQSNVSSSVFDATPVNNTHLLDIIITEPVSKFIKWFLPLLVRK